MQKRFRLDQRAAGVLLHPTSLPGPHGSGDLGPAAFAFVDFLATASQRWWQMLPVVPPGPGDGPYSSTSAMAGSPLLISLELLARDDLLNDADLTPVRGLRAGRVAYETVRLYRLQRLRRAHAAFTARSRRQRAAFDAFCEQHCDWLEDYALFTALQGKYPGRPWTRWPQPLRTRRPAALDQARRSLADDVDFHRFCQFVFDRQWAALRRYAHQRGVGLLGDIPIFVAHQSADVWAHPKLFQLEPGGRPRVVSGVPPDLFSRTGQLWGHPHYDWPRHRRSGFAWWLARFRRTFEQFDAVRVDHFLGFHRLWAVSGRARTAQHGRWVRVPGRALLETLRKTLGPVQIIAEDLGVVTKEATALRDDFGFPGMRLLHFAFGSDGDHYNEPDAYPRQCVVYPGTHDNDTTVGWFRTLRAEARRRGRRRAATPYSRLLRYLGTTGREIHWDIIRLAYMSVANLAVIPAQDLLGLGSAARMNFPGTAEGNWRWRLPPEALTPAIAERLHDLAVTYDRVRSAGAASEK